MVIFKTPKQIRQREIGRTTFATGRANLDASTPKPNCPCKMIQKRMHGNKY